jgi:hypothetical protein
MDNVAKSSVDMSGCIIHNEKKTNETKKELIKDDVDISSDDNSNIYNQFGFPNLTPDRRSSNNYSILLKNRQFLSNYSIPTPKNIISPLIKSLYNSNNEIIDKHDNNIRRKKVNFDPSIKKDMKEDELENAINNYSDNNPEKQMIMEIEKLQNKEDNID